MSRQYNNGLLDGAKVYAMRKARELTQESLAKGCGISHGYVSLIEHNRADKLSITTAKRIAASLKCSLDDLSFATDVEEEIKHLNKEGEGSGKTIGQLIDDILARAQLTEEQYAEVVVFLSSSVQSAIKLLSLANKR